MNVTKAKASVKGRNAFHAGLFIKNSKVLKLLTISRLTDTVIIRQVILKKSIRQSVMKKNGQRSCLCSLKRTIRRLQIPKMQIPY